MDGKEVAEDCRRIRQALEVTIQSFDPVWNKEVILIDEVHGVTAGGRESCLASRPHASGGLVAQEAKTGIPPSDCLDNLRALVAAAVVDNDAFPLAQRLALDAAQAPLERDHPIQDRQDE
jgi:hypothetical protein